MKYAILCAALLMSACGQKITEMQSAPDQCMRTELFKTCMTLLPAGPAATKYNDWDEVVSACDKAAYYQSMRALSSIKPECKP
jgi:hypothetical protein